MLAPTRDKRTLGLTPSLAHVQSHLPTPLSSSNWLAKVSGTTLWAQVYLRHSTHPQGVQQSKDVDPWECQRGGGVLTLPWPWALG